MFWIHQHLLRAGQQPFSLRHVRGRHVLIKQSIDLLEPGREAPRRLWRGALRARRHGLGEGALSCGNAIGEAAEAEHELAALRWGEIATPERLKSFGDDFGTVSRR